VRRAVSAQPTAAHSLLESGIRGSVAAAVAWYSHVAIAPWLLDTGDLATAMLLAGPVIVLEAALFLPSSGKLAAQPGAHKTALYLSALAAAQQWWVQKHRERVVEPLAARVALATLSQVSEEVLARGVLLLLITHWISSRLLEAGIDHTVSGTALRSS
jgi:hypothetical protein